MTGSGHRQTSRRPLRRPASVIRTRTIATKDGGVLRTVEDVRTYMLALPEHRQKGQWQHAVALLLTHGDVLDLTKQVELALFYDAKLDLAK